MQQYFVMDKNKCKTVDEYMMCLPVEFSIALEKLRHTIKQAAPNAEEVISYQIPAFKQNGVLVYYAAFTKHCSFFVASNAVLEKYANELAPYQTSKGTIQFTPNKPLPTALIKKLVKERIKENEAKAKARLEKKRK